MDRFAVDAEPAVISAPQLLAVRHASAAAFHLPYLAVSVAAAVPELAADAAELEAATDIAAADAGSAAEEASADLSLLKTEQFGAAVRGATLTESDAAAALWCLPAEYREQQLNWKFPAKQK